MGPAQTSDSAKRYIYLLSLTGISLRNCSEVCQLTVSNADLFRHFIGNNDEFQKILEEADKKKSKGKKAGDHRRRRTEQEEDEELLQDERADGQEGSTIFTESPSCMLSRNLGYYHFANAFALCSHLRWYNERLPNCWPKLASITSREWHLRDFSRRDGSWKDIANNFGKSSPIMLLQKLTCGSFWDISAMLPVPMGLILSWFQNPL